MHSPTRRRFRLSRAGWLLPILGMAAVSVLAGQGGAAPIRPPSPYVVRSAQAIEGLIRSLQPGPRTADIVRTNQLPFSVSALSERAAEAAEFETHDTRDHVILVLEGTTRFELGGQVELPR